MTPRIASVFLVIAVVASALVASTARAQRPAGEEVARQQLIDRAQAEHKAGAHQAALELAQRAAQIRKTPTLLLFMAEEQEEVGAVADAYALAQQCAREAELNPEAKLREKTIARCRAMADRLRGKVSYVVVNVPDPPPGFNVTLSGQQLNQAAIGVPYVITPGKVTVEAQAPGHVPYRLEIEVPEAKTVNVTVSLAPEPTAPACPPNQRHDAGGRCVNDSCRVGMIPTADGLNCCWNGQTWDEATRSCTGAPACPAGMEPTGSTCVAGTAAALAAESPPPRVHYFKTPALAIAGVGVASLVTGGIVWLVSNGRFNDLKKDCNDADGCTREHRASEVDGIISLDKWVAGFAMGGVVAVGAAAVLQWAVPSRSPSGEQSHAHADAHAHANVTFDPLRRTLLLRGEF